MVASEKNCNHSLTAEVSRLSLVQCPHVSNMPRSNPSDCTPSTNMARDVLMSKPCWCQDFDIQGVGLMEGPCNPVRKVNYGCERKKL